MANPSILLDREGSGLLGSYKFNGVKYIYITPINGRKSMGNWGYFTLLLASFNSFFTPCSYLSQKYNRPMDPSWNPSPFRVFFSRLIQSIPFAGATTIAIGTVGQVANLMSGNKEHNKKYHEPPKTMKNEGFDHLKTQVIYHKSLSYM